MLKATFPNRPYGLSHECVFVVASAGKLVDALFLFLIWVDFIFAAKDLAKFGACSGTGIDTCLIECTS